jgi:excinuclease ABC subunit C
MAHATPDQPFDAKAFLKTLTGRPGVYCMRGAGDRLLYVGKARNLKKRVSSYFRNSGLPPKTQALMRQVVSVDVTVTHTEGEALLLESNLIKANKPRYNILLRDDKSYPYIYLSSEDDYPRLALHRGARRAPGRYFGPYPNAYAVRDSLQLLQKMFQVRQCEDSYFSNRSRPCLQYQIKRCKAPCVGYITPAQYAEDVEHTVLFLDGKSTVLIERLAERMEAAAKALDYESAAVYRDQITSLQKIQQRQYISGGSGNLDIVTAVTGGGSACVQVFFFRDGRNLGSRAFFPRVPDDSDADAVLSAFIAQYYLAHDVPDELILNRRLADAALLAQVLGERAGHKVTLTCRPRGERARWLKMCEANAAQALETRLNSAAGMKERRRALQEMLDLPQPPARIEGFDISHTRGEGTMASCVVFDADGPRKQDYRRFGIEGIAPGDDYAAMRQALTRRYARLQKEAAPLPDILLIDGGKGQTGVAREVMAELDVDSVLVVGVSKGPDRRAGLELIHVPAYDRTLAPAADSPALHLIQQVRDEAHRFAITGHRARRARKRQVSPLERIPGIGPKRRQRLLTRFGGLKEIARAGVEDLARVEGISPVLAQQIYDVFHEGS